MFYKECYDHLAPGGYLEHSETSPVTRSDDGTVGVGDAFDEGGKYAVECGQLVGKPFNIEPHLKDMITEAGFVDVQEIKYKWPIGDWPAEAKLKEIGTWNARHWVEGIEGWTLRMMTQKLGV